MLRTVQHHAIFTSVPSMKKTLPPLPTVTSITSGWQRSLTTLLTERNVRLLATSTFTRVSASKYIPFGWL